MLCESFDSKFDFSMKHCRLYSSFCKKKEVEGKRSNITAGNFYVKKKRENMREKTLAFVPNGSHPLRVSRPRFQLNFTIKKKNTCNA